MSSSRELAEVRQADEARRRQEVGVGQRQRERVRRGRDEQQQRAERVRREHQRELAPLAHSARPGGVEAAHALRRRRSPRRAIAARRRLDALRRAHRDRLVPARRCQSRSAPMRSASSNTYSPSAPPAHGVLGAEPRDPSPPRRRFIGGVPTKRATHVLAGRSHTSSGVPSCSTRPSRSTATRWPSASASPWSCVTCSVVTPVCSCTRRISARVDTRSCASRFDSGSSSSSTRGRAASARASATRWRSPPESSPGRRSSSPSSRSASRRLAHALRRSPRAAPTRRSPNAMLRSHAQVREQREATGRPSRRRAARARRRDLVDPVDQHPPAVRRLEPGDRPQQRRLARSRRRRARRRAPRARRRGRAHAAPRRRRSGVRRPERRAPRSKFAVGLLGEPLDRGRPGSIRP